MNTVPHSAYEDSIVWSITPIIGSNLTYMPPTKKGRTMKFTYSKLPSLNSQFGNKYIKASLAQFNVAESVLVEIFFAKYASNHPSGGIGTPPNWYYYWKQTIASHGNHVYGGPLCIPHRTGYYQDGSSSFHICASASGKEDVQCSSDSADGIDLFAISCIHENQHQLDYGNWWAPHGGWDSSMDRDQGIGDWVPDHLEPSPGMPYSPDSIDTDGDSLIDSEDHAYDRECDWTKHFADSLDWSNPGHQFR